MKENYKKKKIIYVKNCRRSNKSTIKCSSVSFDFNLKEKTFSSRFQI